MKKHILFLLILSPLLVNAQTDWDAIEIKTHQVTGNISFLEGSGGNIGVLHGKDGVMIIDDQFAQLSDKIKSAVAGLSDGELKFIVNTHYHGDHTGGNENLSKGGALIVAQENVRARLKASFSDPIMGREVAAKASTFWPVITFSHEMSFFINDEIVNIVYLPNAHTDGDALVYFKNANVMHTGDAFVRYGYPFIDVSAGGSIDGFIAAQDKILEIADENTKIIPGHGQVSSVNDVRELRDMLAGAKEAVLKLKRQGKTLDDCLNAKPLAKYHERWSGNFINSDVFVRLIYETAK